jgi:hypothetical protein
VVSAAKKRVGRPSKHEGPLAQWLKGKNLRRDDFATELGISRRYLDSLCRQAKQPSFPLAAKIKARTGLSDGDLLITAILQRATSKVLKS